jgi:DNA-damage-inducible protein J
MLALKTTDVRSRVEPELKEEATDVLAQCGLTLSDGIRLFLRQVVTVRGLPFDIKVPNAEAVAAIKEARAMTRARFSTAQDLFDDLEKNSRVKARKTTAKKRLHERVST